MFFHKIFNQIAFEIEVFMSISSCIKTSFIFIIHSFVSLINPIELRAFGCHIQNDHMFVNTKLDYIK